MKFEIPDLPAAGIRCLGTLTARPPERVMDEADIRLTMEHPVRGRAGRPVFDSIVPGEKVCIVVSDHTRKTAADRVLPVLMEGLAARGCSPDDMFILFATGIHRHPTGQEARQILGDAVADQFKDRIFMHDPDAADNLVTVGTTRSGGVVRLNRRAVEAQRLILTGAVTYHYHAGFGGGRKSLVPGLAARETIAHNHSRSLDLDAQCFHPGVHAGALDGNPVALEMLEGALMRPPDFIVNTVLTPDNRLAGIFAGDMTAAHAAACRCAESICRCDIGERADIVIAAAGSASNWIQAHKALYNADRAVKPGGKIVLFAPCPEGLGNERFRFWLTRPTTGELFAGLRGNPEVNGQTALSTRIRGAGTILVTRMPPAESAALGMATAPDTGSALARALDSCRSAGVASPTCYVMPEALYTVPFAR